jgi:hypothetical protein
MFRDSGDETTARVLTDGITLRVLRHDDDYGNHCVYCGELRGADRPGLMIDGSPVCSRCHEDQKRSDEESSHAQSCPARYGGPCTMGCET